MSAAAQQTIYWKKDHVYNGPGGKEIAIVVPSSTDQTAPAAPSSLAYSNVTATSVQLSWSASTDSGGSGLAGYKVYRQQASGASLPVGTVGTGTLSFVDQPLLSSTSYSYTIVAFDLAQNHSAASANVNITTLVSSGDTSAPDAPGNLRGRGLTRATTYKVRLDWDAATDSGGSGIAGYEVYRDNTLISGASPVSNLYYEDATSTAKTSYTYKLKAVDGANNKSGYSSAVTVTTLREQAYFDDFNRADESYTGAFAVQANTLELVSPAQITWYDRLPLSSSLTDFRATVLVLNRPANVYSGIFFWGDSGVSRYRAVTIGSVLYLSFYDYQNNETVVASASGIPSGPGTLVVDAVSSSRVVQVYWNGTLKINYTETNTSRPNSGKVGLTGDRIGTTTGELVFDDFLVEK